MKYQKANFVVFSKPSNKTKVQRERVTLNNETIECSEYAKHSGPTKLNQKSITSNGYLYTVFMHSPFLFRRKKRLLVFKTLIVSNLPICNIPLVLVGGVQISKLPLSSYQLGGKSMFFFERNSKSCLSTLKNTVFTVQIFLDENIGNTKMQIERVASQ